MKNVRSPPVLVGGRSIGLEAGGAESGVELVELVRRDFEMESGGAEGEHHALVAKLAADAKFPGATEVVRIDGLRVEYADGFGLARGSNTTPVIVLRFEADDAAALERIKGEFRRVLAAAKPGIALPF